jgi:hypothetical protein
MPNEPEFEPRINTGDYRNAPSGEGPLAGQWADKPHRLVYDLANEVTVLRSNMNYVADMLDNGADLNDMIRYLRYAARQ